MCRGHLTPDASQHLGGLGFRNCQSRLNLLKPLSRKCLCRYIRSNLRLTCCGRPSPFSLELAVETPQLSLRQGLSRTSSFGTALNCRLRLGVCLCPCRGSRLGSCQCRLSVL